MKNKYIKSVLFICVTLLFCACEQQVDDIQLINGPSCCTSCNNVSWDGDMVTLYDIYSAFSFKSKVSGTLIFYYKSSTSRVPLRVLKDGDEIFYGVSTDLKKVVFNNVQRGEKFVFERCPYNNTWYYDDVLVNNIIITAGNGNNSNNSDNPGFDF